MVVQIARPATIERAIEAAYRGLKSMTPGSPDYNSQQRIIERLRLRLAEYGRRG